MRKPILIQSLLLIVGAMVMAVSKQLAVYGDLSDNRIVWISTIGGFLVALLTLVWLPTWVIGYAIVKWKRLEGQNRIKAEMRVFYIGFVLLYAFNYYANIIWYHS